uniref:Acyl-CoA N-acyltransferase n=1 Tax=Mycena chlorophos TaxID=658473 RepID=A0ABQ0L4R1_MYCCL|nr:acyl-CoA N-acyltransferase [Mycena chlorophos]
MTDSTTTIPPGVLEALAASSSRPKPPSRILASFAEEHDGADGLLTGISMPEPASGVLVNKYDLLCPRPGCGSVILRTGVGKLVSDRPSVQMTPSGHAENATPATATLLPPLPDPPALCDWWLVGPTPMEFENVGFTNATSHGATPMKLLTCAECDLGPLGWSEVGGTEFWLACARVAYRTA